MTVSPCWFAPVVRHVTMPIPGLLVDKRMAMTRDLAVRVSPGYIGRANVHWSTPRNGPPRSLRSSTDSATAVLRMSIGLTTTSGCPWDRAYSELRCRGNHAHVAVEKDTLSARVRVR